MEIQWFDEEYSQELLKIKNAPDKIYAEGDSKLLNNPSGIVAIVGSRNCSEYARKYAREFASNLSKCGITIISGLALGVDTSAHLGGLCGNGKTIAVIGSGLDKVVPEENIWLYNKILQEGGLIISEKDYGEEIKKDSYQKRNRIISGIADAVLIIEAKKNSGSLITARIANEQAKKVFFIPTRLGEKNSSGIDYLIEIKAQMVTKAGDILKSLKKENLSINLTKEVAPQYKKIYSILEKPKNAEEISFEIDEEISEVNTKLTIMELEGLITRDEKGMFVKS